jgi:hypothetical protein
VGTTTLVFSATNGAAGREVWVLANPEAAPAPEAAPSAGGDADDSGEEFSRIGGSFLRPGDHAGGQQSIAASFEDVDSGFAWPGGIGWSDSMARAKNPPGQPPLPGQNGGRIGSPAQGRSRFSRAMGGSIPAASQIDPAGLHADLDHWFDREYADPSAPENGLANWYRS